MAYRQKLLNRDPFTGRATMWQAARVDDQFLTLDGSFNVDAYNAATGEQIDVGNVNSMAAVYGLATSYFKAQVLPYLGFIKREGPLCLSCLSSLQADAGTRVTVARTAQSEAGRQFGARNLIRWVVP